MNFIQSISWQDIFAHWREREASNPGWIKCATEIKGWSSWDEWRDFTAEQISAESREWNLYQFTNPMDEIPQMLMGPYSGWQKYSDKKNALSFADLLEIPEAYDAFSKHSGVLRIMDGLPFSTEMIGLWCKEKDRIICIEGHHRATAIALAKKQGREIDFSGAEMRIALAEIRAEELPLLDTILERGTSKESYA